MSKQNFRFEITTMNYQVTNFGDISVDVMISGRITRPEVRACSVTVWLCPLLTGGPWGQLLA